MNNFDLSAKVNQASQNEPLSKPISPQSTSKNITNLFPASNSSSSSSSKEINAFSITIEEKDARLSAWMEQGKSSEDRATAGERILEVRSTKKTTLDLESLGLTTLPDEVYSFTFLHRLVIRNNKISQLSKDIGNLTLLTSLDISKNNIEELPEEIEKLTSLTWLHVYTNNIKKFPEALNLLCLYNFLFYNNNFINLPSFINNKTPYNIYLSSKDLLNMFEHEDKDLQTKAIKDATEYMEPSGIDLESSCYYITNFFNFQKALNSHQKTKYENLFGDLKNANPNS